MRVLIALLSLLAVLGVVLSEFTRQISPTNPKLSTLQNEYLQVSFDAESHSIQAMSADFLGSGEYGSNLLVQPFQLEVSFPSATSGKRLSRKSQQDPVFNKIDCGKFELKAASTLVIEGVDSINEEWNVFLETNTRSIIVGISGKTLTDLTVNNLLYSVYVNNPSIYGLFEHGSFQMMNKDNACLGSNSTLQRAYFMGNGGAIDVAFQDSDKEVSENVFISANSGPYKAAIQHVVAGHYPSINREMELAWSAKCWSNVEAVTVPSGTTWSLTVTFLPNNYDFPAFLMNDIPVTSSNMEFLDLRTSLTAMYGSPMGCIQSYYAQHDGMIAPTIAHPDIGYSPLTNFFDPDNFISLSSILYSNDPYLLNEVKKIVKRTGETMCGIGSYQNPVFCNSKTARKHHQTKGSYEVAFDSHYGQIMHHFDRLNPDYNSIAGSVQLGPNIFWSLTALRYVSVTQDNAFATEILPFIEMSTNFLLTLFNNEIGLLNAPGPLWIDVFVRENYTTDSNAMLIPYLEEVANFYDYMSFKPDQATTLRSTAKTIIASINKYLWNEAEGDHFITQMNTDLTTTRDFVDYDGNLIALAFGVVQSEDQAKKIFNRIDSNPFAHARATWVSEKEYTGEPSDCYSGPVGNGLCGDSNMTMARIGWVDSLARKRYNDKETFQQLLLAPLQQDLIKNVWLTERYDQNGNAIRTPYYFEYASLVAIMLREVAYGINVDLLTVTIHPLIYTEGFDYSMGSMKIYYHPESEIYLELPGDVNNNLREKQTILHGLKANQNYQVIDDCFGSYSIPSIAADSNGVLSFPMKYASGCLVTVKLEDYSAN